MPGVVAVQADQLNHPLTDSSPAFIGAPMLYNALGSDTTAGKGAIVEESDLTAKAAESGGRPALFTTGDALVEIVDASTLKFYGDTYRRKLP